VANLHRIIADVDALLHCGTFDDYCPNGLQVAGRDAVGHVVSGVSGQYELFERAIAEHADLVLVHHGIFWSGDDPRIVGAHKRRLELLLTGGVSLAAYHLPLDGHPEIGNNALIAKGIGAGELQPFARHKSQHIGVQASFAPDPIPIDELISRIGSLCGREPLAFTSGPASVRSVAIVSGAGTDYLGDAIAAGVDAFVTGEPTERAMAQARENAIHYIAAGHYSTEIFGVRALGELIAERHGVTHTFVDIFNPI
jgi:dinuclear metal center YbgI/SA1388 family protein